MSQYEDAPKTPEEAIAQGYKPITDLNAFIRQKRGLIEEEFQHLHSFSPSLGVDCAKPENLNQVCRRDDGLGIICYCGPNKICNCFGK